MFRDSKLSRILYMSILLAVSFPLLNILLIYPKFNTVLISNMENIAVRLAVHIQGNLGEGWDDFVRGEGHEFTAEFPTLLKDFELLKMKIFSASGMTVYSSDTADIGKLNTKPYFHGAVAQGNIFSKVVKKRAKSLEGQVFDADVVEIYVPVMQDNQFAGAFELYYDISVPLGSLNRTFWYSSILPFIVTTILVLFTMVVLKSLDRNFLEKQKVESDLKKSLRSTQHLADKLKIKNQELDQQHEQLKLAQSQMLQREKMASIGQLSAGVAHEINNPMGFITSNLGTLRKYLQKMIAYLGYQDELLASNLSEGGQQNLAAERKKYKIDLLLEDIPDLLEESLDGADRVKTIVQNLKSFSHVDEAELKPSNLNDCLDSTLNIIWNELKYKVTLHKDYGDLPDIECYPQQLNQVFLNLLVNSAHAIEKEGTVKIKTWSDSDWAYVEIADNGCGIPAEIQPRIFEPFFTTKDVGKGTGLGMSISYDIVIGHGGDILLKSAPGEGTTFTIKLPIARKEVAV